MWGTDTLTHCHPHIIVTPQVSIILQDGAPSNSEIPGHYNELLQEQGAEEARDNHGVFMMKCDAFSFIII